MTTKETIMKKLSLSSIPETMLIPLWAKATETMRGDGMLHDEYSIKILNAIDYDFHKFSHSKMSQVGCCIRACLIDGEVRSFLSRHPDAVVIQLGAGLDARYQRLGMPPVTHWYDLDLKEALDIRRRFLPESERNTYIEQSMFDDGWIQLVKSHHKPVLIIIEGVLMYFRPETVKKFFIHLCEAFDKATILMDMLAFALVRHAKYHDAVRNTEHKAEFLWSVLLSNEMESWHPKLHLRQEYYMSDHDNKRFPWIARVLYKTPYFYRRFNQRIIRLEID